MLLSLVQSIPTNKLEDITNFRVTVRSGEEFCNFSNMKKSTSLLISSFFLIAFTGCVEHKIIYSNWNDWLPADFDPKNTTLMVEITSDPMTPEEIKMTEYVKENYPYKCTFVYHSDIYTKTGTFGDAKTYRYALISKSFFQQSAIPTNRDLIRKDFYFYDRLNDKNFPITNRSSNKKIHPFIGIINTIVNRYK